jgi:hypothetical protein
LRGGGRKWTNPEWIGKRDCYKLCRESLSGQAPGFADAFRGLKPHGCLAISDLVARFALPEKEKMDLPLYSGCMAGTMPIGEIIAILESCEFENIEVHPKGESRNFIHNVGSPVENCR